MLPVSKVYRTFQKVKMVLVVTFGSGKPDKAQGCLVLIAFANVLLNAVCQGPKLSNGAHF
jgi:hypothetical protein